MDSQLSQDSLSSPQRLVEASEPSTPEPAHATIPKSTLASVSTLQANRIDNATIRMTPPHSSQVPSSQRAKTRTPTPTVSHISTPPPTIETFGSTQPPKFTRGYTGIMSPEQIATAPIEELRSMIVEVQASLQEAKMSAAHHKLQYQMLSQERAAAIERMAVEADMAQNEYAVIRSVEKNRKATTPIQSSLLPEGAIPVQKDFYQRMCRDIQSLTEDRNYLAQQNSQMDRLMQEQEYQIVRLNEQIELLRERIRENREQVHRHRQAIGVESMPHSVYTTPLRHGVSSHEQPQPFAALLQASEMASQEARRPFPSASKKGHSRNMHSMSSLPATPHRSFPGFQQQQYHTPHGRHPPLKVPSTAPIPRTSALQTPDIYAHPQLPVTRSPGGSEGTVTASDEGEDEVNDSEAETDIIEPDASISESQASRTASQMLRTSHEEQRAKRESFQGSGMLPTSASSSDRYRQTKLFGAVRKPNVVRAGPDNLPPAKRQRTTEQPEAVGLGIAGVRH